MPPLSPPRRPWGLSALLFLAILGLASASGLTAAVPDGGVVVLVTRDYINRQGGKARTDPVNVTDDVGKLSVQTRGQGTAYPKIFLIPSEDAARFHVVTRGTGSSISEGRGNKLCVVTSHTSTFCLEQIICLTSKGVSGEVICAKSNANSKLECVSTDRVCGGGLVRFAVKAAFRLTPGKIDKLATERATKYTREKGNEFLAKMAEKGNQLLEERLLAPVRRYGVQADDIYFQTTSEYVRVSVDAKTGPTGPVRPVAPSTAVAVQIHQTLIEGGAARQAGRKVTSKEIQSVLKPAAKRAGVSLPTPLADIAWSFTLAKREPVKLRIENDGFTLAVRLDAFTIEEQVYPPVEITTRYLLKERDGWPLLVREGRVGARVLDEKKKPNGDRWREELVEVLETVLLKEVSLAQVMRDDLAPLVKQAGLQEKPRVTARDGWLLAEYDAAETTQAPAAVETPRCPQ